MVINIIAQIHRHTHVIIMHTYVLIRNHIWGVMGAIQLLRRLQYWLRTLMVFLRLRQFEHSVSTCYVELSVTIDQFGKWLINVFVHVHIAGIYLYYFIGSSLG